MQTGSNKRTALITGGNGIIGRNLTHHLQAGGSWEVLVTSHNPLSYPTAATFLEMDLLQPGAVSAHARLLKDVTHVFFAAYIERHTLAEQTAVNTQLLDNLVTGLEQAAPRLERIVFVQGGKAYGAHFGLYKTPALETDSRHFPPNFYYAQEDLLRSRAAGKSWSWTALRPDIVFGIAQGNPMNLASVIAIYATLCKELNVPFRFPGPPEAYQVLVNVTDAGLLAQALEWAAVTGSAANEAFNITNGDIFRWSQAWPRIAAYFGVAPAEPQPFSLSTYMADKGPLWQQIVKQYNLQPNTLENLVQWAFGDAILNQRYDAFLDVNKARRYGFHQMNGDSISLMLAAFEEMRKNRIIP